MIALDLPPHILIFKLCICHLHLTASTRRMFASNLISAAAYPALASYYIVQSVGDAIMPRRWYCEMIAGLILVLRLADFSALERFSVVISVMSFIPSVLFIFAAIPHVKTSTWTDSVGAYNCSLSGSSDDDWSIGEGVCQVPVDWGSLLSYSLWYGLIQYGVHRVCNAMTIESDDKVP